MPIFIRGGCGGSSFGYKPKMVPEISTTYSGISFFGYQSLETSTVDTLPRPAEPLELYEFEACPFCKKVREAITILDLDVKVYPCPKNGTTWRPRVLESGGKLQFPFLVDKNTGKSMYESDAIVKYLFETYGHGRVPKKLQPSRWLTFTLMVALMMFFGRGRMASPKRLKDTSKLKPITLWAFELSPFSAFVRATLCELELPYYQITCGRGSPKRIPFFEKHGRFQVPYIEDPNRGISLFESDAIIKYLNETYGNGTGAVELTPIKKEN